MKDLTHLGYIFQKYNRHEKHVEERMKKARGVTERVGLNMKNWKTLSKGKLNGSWAV